MLKILFIGDINGKIGRETVKKILPKIKKETKPDLVIANAENIAHGSGATKDTLNEVMDAGVDWFTAGDHAFDNKGQLNIYSDDKLPILRPANYPSGVPGKGYKIVEVNNHKVLIINLIGRVFMSMDYDCPFRKLDKILSQINKDSMSSEASAKEGLSSEASAKEGIVKRNLSAIIIDIHAEATSEKAALGHYVDGRVSAVLGTHTHIMTADPKITDKGMAYITDVGMVGAADGVIGGEKEHIIQTFLTQIKHRHQLPEKGEAVFNAVLVSINPKTAKAVSLRPIIKYTKIN